MDTVRTPSDTQAVFDAVCQARDHDTAIRIRGGGTKLDWASTASRSSASTVIDTSKLTGIVEHDPGDMTATVLAGTALDDLQAKLAAQGQQLAIDPPHRGGAPTVGGIIAANDAGPRRLKYGAMRDLLIGSLAVLADGTVVRSGGRVIKNVAGYDLNKLWCGSLGSLGVITEVTLRLHPLPESRRAVIVGASAGDATSFVTSLLASPVECSAVEWSSPKSALLLEVEGRATGLARQVDQLLALARRAGLTTHVLDDDDGQGGGNGQEGGNDWREAHARDDQTTTIARASTLPSGLATAVTDLADAARDTPVTTALHSHAALSLHDAILTGGTAADHATVIAGWRARLSDGGGTVVLRDHLAGVSDLVDRWGPMAPRLVTLMHAVKSALDPDGRLPPGPFPAEPEARGE